jgi:inhibitor of KinA
MIRSVIPSAGSVLIELNIERYSQSELWSFVEQAIESFGHSQCESPSTEVQNTRLVEIPVCYDEQFALDLRKIAQMLECPMERVIELHSSAKYVVDVMGFMPGFGYLGSLHEKLKLPRKDTPRMRVPAGSVGIAEGMTAVYPNQCAGGWLLIGRTPMRLFDPRNPDPAMLRVGDSVRFVQISHDVFERIAAEQWGGG